MLKGAKHPIVLVGAGALARHDGAAVLGLAAKVASGGGALKDGWNGFAVLQDTASRAGALDIGFAAGADGLNLAQMTTFGTLDVPFLLGADEVKAPDGTFVVYIGTHGDRGAHRADVILPGAAYTEKSGIYVNTEGRVQIASRAAIPPGEAREDRRSCARCRMCSARSCPTISCRRRQALAKGGAGSDADRPDRARQGRGRQGIGGQEARRETTDPVPEFSRGLLFHPPHRAGLGADGGFPAGVRRNASEGSRMSVT